MCFCLCFIFTKTTIVFAKKFVTFQKAHKHSFLFENRSNRERTCSSLTRSIVPLTLLCLFCQNFPFFLVGAIKCNCERHWAHFSDAVRSVAHI